MKWISVKDRLPKDYQRVLATDGKDCDFLHLSNEFYLSDAPQESNFGVQSITVFLLELFLAISRIGWK
jgi:hypothetical protein